jgi:hypothetical protein
VNHHSITGLFSPLKSKEELFVRPLRIIGISLSAAAVFLAANWFSNTLVPLNRLNSLQPAIASTEVSPASLLECTMSQNWSANLNSLLLTCNGDEVQVNKRVTDIKNMPPDGAGRPTAIKPSDPIVLVGTKELNSNVINAEFVAYGNRGSNLSAFQSSGILQIILAEVVGGLGILALFIDWRIARARRVERTMQAWQAEQAYAASPQLVEQPVYQRRR